MNDLPSATNFWHWVNGAKPGDRIVYHCGHLDNTRTEVGFEALKAHNLGLVFLCQKRRNWEGGGFDYIAVRLSREAAEKLGLSVGAADRYAAHA